MLEAAASEMRHFLFLQGPSSTVFRKIGGELASLGHRVTRINLSAGDWVFWHGSGTRNYRGRLSEWPAFLTNICRQLGVTDLVLLGEERPHHKAAIIVAKQLGIEAVVVEMGYFRPDWITLERGGMSSNSHFPTDPNLIRRLASDLPKPDYTKLYNQSFLVDAASDLAFNLSNVFLSFLFPYYRWHSLDHPLAEYGGWLRKFARASARRRATEAAIRALYGRSYFLYPLQLETDYQIRSHSPFQSQFDAITMVLEQFAGHAPAQYHLVLKVHPLDNDLRDWAGFADDLAQRLGLRGRVQFLHHGNLEALLAAAAGVVTINSTVGLQALIGGRPVKVLGTALFDIVGLTDQRPLGTFFENPMTPDADLRDAFLSVAAATIHVRGNFYSRKGTDAGAYAIARRLHDRSVNEPGAYVEPPPRRR